MCGSPGTALPGLEQQGEGGGVPQEMLQRGAAAVDTGNQSRVPGADGVTGQEQLEKEMKIIISQRQQPMHDLDRNHCSSFLLQHQRTSRNLDYQWPAAEKRKDIRRSTSGGGEGDPISLTPSSPHPAVLHMALSHPSNSSILPLPRISFKPPSMSFSSPKTKLQTSAPLSLNSKIEEKLYPPSPASSLCLGIITSSNLDYQTPCLLEAHLHALQLLCPTHLQESLPPSLNLKMYGLPCNQLQRHSSA